MKNHQKIDGQLLQTNKKYSHLKLKQKEKIYAWMVEKTRQYYIEHEQFPTEKTEEEVLDKVYGHIEDASIWIPYGEVVRHYHSIRTKLFKRLRRENAVKKHKPEQVIFMNMCMICDGDQVLALNKVGKNYSGITFPGGHVEHGEIYADAVIREIYEETGLTITDPVLRGIYHWYRDGLHNVGLLYKATKFSGELKSSDEGEVYWIPLEEYQKLSLATGMKQVLQIMEKDEFTECFMDVHDDGSITEHVR